MTINEISKRLSYRIEDPVTGDGADDGNRFNATIRLMYINSAVMRLIQILETFHYDVSHALPDYFELLEIGPLMKSQPSAPSSSASTPVPSADVDPYAPGIYDKLEFPSSKRIVQCYIKDNNLTAPILASRLTPVQFLSHKNDTTGVQQATKENRYFCLLESVIHFLPQVTSISTTPRYDNVTLMVRNTTVNYSYGKELPIASEFVPLLIALASEIAMADISNSNKFQLYRQEIKDYIDIMTVQKREYDVNPNERP